MKQSDIHKAYSGLMLTFILWGSLYVVSKVVLAELPTFAVAFSRYLVAYLFLTLVVCVKKQKTGTISDKTNPKKHDRTFWKYMIILGFFGYTVSIGLQLLGTKFAGSSAASLINSLNPVAITVMAAVILREPLSKEKVTGILLSMAGVYMIIGGGAQINLTGILLSLASVSVWSLISVIIRKELSQYDSLAVTRYAVGIAAVCNLVLCVIEICFYDQPIKIHGTTILGLLYMGICCTGITNILWNRGLKMLPACNCSAFYPVQTLTSAVLGGIFFHEKFTAGFIAGAVCIICGIIISLMRPIHVFPLKNSGTIHS